MVQAECNRARSIPVGLHQGYQADRMFSSPYRGCMQLRPRNGGVNVVVMRW